MVAMVRRRRAVGDAVAGISPRVVIANPEVPREPGVDRKVVDVAVGILVDSGARFLLTSRPVGKAYAGYWEFPGGKLEAGDTVEQAVNKVSVEMIVPPRNVSNPTSPYTNGTRPFSSAFCKFSNGMC